MPDFTAAPHLAVRAGWAVLVVLTLVGCNHQAGNDTPGRGATGSASPAATSTSVPPPSASARPRPTAADEVRYAACGDGTCEVYVAAPVQIKVRRGTVSVTRVKADDAVDVDVTLNEGGGGSGTLKGTCGFTATFYYGGGGTGRMCGASGNPEWPTPIPGALSIQMVGWSSNDAAVLRLVSG